MGVASVYPSMGDKEWGPANVFDVFGDPLARRILVLASERSLSADELARELDVSRPTIYRRVNALIDYDLLQERQQIDRKGNHFQSFETAFERVTFEVTDGGYDIDLQLRQNLVDQFESFWTDLEGTDAGPTAAANDHRDTRPTESRSNDG